MPENAKVENGTRGDRLPESMPTVSEFGVSNEDQDALHILPLAVIPFKSSKLKSCRLIKNAKLESVVELFSGFGSGSGQIDPDLIHQEFHWPQGMQDSDYIMMNKLARLPSYDVYSLRISLRQQNIKIEDTNQLKLSAEMAKKLNSYMLPFTRPLIKELFGDHQEFESFAQLINSISTSDTRTVRHNLNNLAQRLDVDIQEIPEFLKNYGDVYLSLNYFRNQFDLIVPKIDSFMETASEICNHPQLKNNQNLVATCRSIANTLSDKMTDIVGILEIFSANSDEMWQGLTGQKFAAIAENIIRYHTTIGGILCMLSVKLDVWHTRFPDTKSFGPNRRADFIMSDMKQGMDKISAFNTKVPLISRTS